jgi:hypothetical protein
MIGINVTKIIQNLEVLYNLASIFPLPNLVGAVFFFLSASLFFLISDLENGAKLLPLSPAVRGGWRANESHSPRQYGTQISELGPYVLPVWSMAPLPLRNEYQFPQLGPHWIGQSNCYSLNP